MLYSLLKGTESNCREFGQYVTVFDLAIAVEMLREFQYIQQKNILQK